MSKTQENPTLKNSFFLCEKLNIKYPIILAPMFLVSNVEMVLAALNSGITAAIPALNYRSTDELRSAIQTIKSKSDQAFGINLIVNKSNIYLADQLAICCEEKVAFIITSLGSPTETIKKAHAAGILVFCDVVNLKYALKVEQRGADALVAVGSEAGGHAGPTKSIELVKELKEKCQIPIISAGGVCDAATYTERLSWGIGGVSVGSIFIATEESPVSDEYKQACISYGAQDIVMTTKLSGTPCTIINTPYVKEIGTEQTWIQYFLNKNRRIKKWLKALVFFRGMKSLERAAFGTTYKTVWCAGPAIEQVHEITTIQERVRQLTQPVN